MATKRLLLVPEMVEIVSMSVSQEVGECQPLTAIQLQNACCNLVVIDEVSQVFRLSHPTVLESVHDR